MEVRMHGMSSEKGGENPPRRKPKGSKARLVRLSLAGPKPRAKAVGDGQPVNIPAPLRSVDRWGDADRVASGPLVVAGQTPRGAE